MLPTAGTGDCWNHKADPGQRLRASVQPAERYWGRCHPDRDVAAERYPEPEWAAAHGRAAACPLQ